MVISDEYKLNIVSPETLNTEEYFNLFRKVYGNINRFSDRWQWQYKKYPLSKHIKVYLLYHKGKIVAATTRFPYKVKFENHEMLSWFGIDSLTDPDFVRKGLMKYLYETAMKQETILLSRGTMPAMYRLLMGIGYKPVEPATFLVKYFNVINWVQKKILRRNLIIQFSHSSLPDNIELVGRFGEIHQIFCDKFSQMMTNGFLKNIEYLNWRYIDIPHRQYYPFVYSNSERIKWMVLLTFSGSTGRIVDIVWDINDPASLTGAIEFSVRQLKKAGCTRIECWTTYRTIRHQLKKMCFFDLGQSPRFSGFLSIGGQEKLYDFNNFIMVDGDGDYEILRG